MDFRRKESKAKSSSSPVGCHLFSKNIDFGARGEGTYGCTLLGLSFARS